jgi:hypothetical protein
MSLLRSFRRARNRLKSPFILVPSVCMFAKSLLSLVGVIILLFKGRSASNCVSSDKTMAGGAQKKPSLSDVEIASGVVFCGNCGN